MPSVLSTDALTTLSNAKEVLGISSSVTTYDNQIERLINRATAEIERMTNRKLKARNYNGKNVSPGVDFTTTAIASEDYIYFSGRTQDCGGDTLVDAAGYGVFYLPQFPVQTASPSVTFALAILSDRTGSGTWDTSSLVENTDYVIDRDNGILTNLNGRFQPGFRNYRITCTAGYLANGAQPYVPYDLEELCIAMVKKLYRNEQGLQSESIGTWSRTFNAEANEKYINEQLSLFSRKRL